jgi:hypothetical protein
VCGGPALEALSSHVIFSALGTVSADVSFLVAVVALDVPVSGVGSSSGMGSFSGMGPSSGSGSFSRSGRRAGRSALRAIFLVIYIDILSF